MNDFAKQAVEAAVSAGCSYADARVVQQRHELIRVRNGSVDDLAYSESYGFGVRVIVEGGWGFASSSRIERGEIPLVVRRAVAIGKASGAGKRGHAVLAPAPVVVGRYETPVQRQPLSVPIEEKLALLLGLDGRARRTQGVSVSQAEMEFLLETKVFASSEGSLIEQEICHSGSEVTATAVSGAEVQRRTAGGSWGSGGYELVAGERLWDDAERIGKEAVALLDAPQCPSGRSTIILDPPQMALQIHESCGHPIELDRVFGTEASFAGTSFLTTDKLGNFRYGSDVVNITADATVAGGLGTFGYDDEGIPAQATPIIRDGMFVGYLSSRETAAQLGVTSSGAMRADGWNRIPLIRMTNINLEPGTWSLADLIADTDDGLYMSRNRSWSIDDRRLNFQFATEIAWEIKGGKLGRMLKNPTYTGITPEFWGSCDAVGDRDHWELWGTPNCGKGEPMQVAHVGHGTAPVRFRGVQVGVGKW